MEDIPLTKTLLIVGGSSGIGAATLDLALLRGHRVIQASRHPELARVVPAVTSLEWDACGGEFPTQSLPDVLDGLVYCPGGIRLKPFARLSAAELREDLEVSLIGAVRAVQAALPALKRGQGAGIVLFSTVAVRLGMPFHAAVASAKGAVEGLTRALAAELAPGIRVNAIAPTLTDTPLAARLLSSEERRQAAAERHPLKRIGEPGDVARTVLWLLDEAPMVTGQIIALDGGLSGLRLA